jgi:hypothetical protein
MIIRTGVKRIILNCNADTQAVPRNPLANVMGSCSISVNGGKAAIVNYVMTMLKKIIIHWLLEFKDVMILNARRNSK